MSRPTDNKGPSPTVAPYLRAQALHESTLRIGGLLLLGSIAINVVTGWAGYRAGAAATAAELPWLVVTASGVMEVHPRTFASEAVAAFGWDKAQALLNVSSDSVERRFSGLRNWTSRALQLHLEQDLEAMGESLHTSWAEAFAADLADVEVLEISSSVTGQPAGWEVTVPGRLTSYAAGLQIESRPEVVTLLVRPQAYVGPEQPNVLEVVEVWRRTEGEHARYAQARDRLQAGELL